MKTTASACGRNRGVAIQRLTSTLARTCPCPHLSSGPADTWSPDTARTPFAAQRALNGHAIFFTYAERTAQPEPLPSRLPHIGLPGKEMSKCLSVRYRSKHFRTSGMAGEPPPKRLCLSPFNRGHGYLILNFKENTCGFLRSTCLPGLVGHGRTRQDCRTSPTPEIVISMVSLNLRYPHGRTVARASVHGEVCDARARLLPAPVRPATTPYPAPARLELRRSRWGLSTVTISQPLPSVVVLRGRAM